MLNVWENKDDANTSSREANLTAIFEKNMKLVENMMNLTNQWNLTHWSLLFNQMGMPAGFNEQTWVVFWTEIQQDYLETM